MVRLRGHWLAREGFAEGRKYSVDALLGTLTLTLADRPQRTDYSPQEAQTLLAGIARRLGEQKTLLEEIRDGLPRSPDEDRMLEVEIPSDLATKLRGVLEMVVDDNLTPAIKLLEDAAGLTLEDLVREFKEQTVQRSRARQLFAAVAPQAAELLDGDPPPRRRRSRRRRPRVH